MQQYKANDSVIDEKTVKLKLRENTVRKKLHKRRSVQIKTLIADRDRMKVTFVTRRAKPLQISNFVKGFQ